MKRMSLVLLFCLAVLFAGCKKESTNSTGVPADGEKLVQQRCASCHTLDLVYGASKDRSGWETTVDRMIDKDTQLNAGEREAVIDYLSGR